MRFIKFKDWIKIRESFSSTLNPQKNQWVTIDKNTIDKDPSIADELFSLIDQAYGKIGGHVDFRSPQDIINAFHTGDINIIKAVDVDELPDPDALTIYKSRGGGMKAVASAAKASHKPSKDSLMNYKKESLHKNDHYCEVSDAMAKVLLEMGVPVVEDENTVRRVLAGKQIIWYGQHPDLASMKESVRNVFGRYNGWYATKGTAK